MRSPREILFEVAWRISNPWHQAYLKHGRSGYARMRRFGLYCRARGIVIFDRALSGRLE